MEPSGSPWDMGPKKKQAGKTLAPIATAAQECRRAATITPAIEDLNHSVPPIQPFLPIVTTSENSNIRHRVEIP